MNAPELQLFRELSGIEISHRPGLDFARIDLRVIESLFAGLDDQMPDGFAFLFQVALKIGAPAAENVNVVHVDPMGFKFNVTAFSEMSSGVGPYRAEHTMVLHQKCRRANSRPEPVFK